MLKSPGDLPRETRNRHEREKDIVPILITDRKER